MSSLRKRTRNGFTVIETLVFATILLVLMGSIVLVIQGGLRYMRTTTAYQDAQRQVVVGIQKMREDLSKSTTARREPPSPLLDSDHIIFLSPTPPPPDVDWTYDGSDLEYHYWVCYYFDSSSNELVRIQIPIPPSTSNETADPPELADFLSQPKDNNWKVVARDIQSMTVNDGPTSRQLSLRMTSSVSTGTDKTTEVTSRTMVTMPNP